MNHIFTPQIAVINISLKRNEIVMNNQMSMNKMNKYGFKSYTSLEEGVKKTTEWFLNNKDILDNSAKKLISIDSTTAPGNFPDSEARIFL